MSDNNADFNGTGQVNNPTSDNAAQADYNQPYIPQQNDAQMNHPESQPETPAYDQNSAAYTQPAQPAEPAQSAQPSYGQPAAPAYDPNNAYAQPDYNQANYGQQGYAAPSYNQSAYTQPAYAQQPAYGQPVAPAGYAQKSKLAAGLLGIFLGCFGVHNFYLGNTGKAVAQLLLTVIGCILIIGPAVAGIWGLVEGILILCSHYGSQWHRDAQGVELQD